MSAEYCAEAGALPWCDGALTPLVIAFGENRCEIGPCWQLPWVRAGLPRVTRLWERQRAVCASTGAGEVCDAE